MGQSNWVHLEDCTILRRTDRALLVHYDGGDYWMPLSQVSEPDNLDEGDEGVTVSVTEWIAGQKGLA